MQIKAAAKTGRIVLRIAHDMGTPRRRGGRAGARALLSRVGFAERNSYILSTGTVHFNEFLPMIESSESKSFSEKISEH